MDGRSTLREVPGSDCRDEELRDDESDPEGERNRATGLDPLDLNSRMERLFPKEPEDEESRRVDRTELSREDEDPGRLVAEPSRVEV
ncbi:MAG: hypothetical protein MUP19_04885 [Candidatus Aminicenantes bacterium]|nr:hypothetical protein [Candidatus Aminicenantes bacterium]